MDIIIIVLAIAAMLVMLYRLHMSVLNSNWTELRRRVAAFSERFEQECEDNDYRFTINLLDDYYQMKKG